MLRINRLVILLLAALLVTACRPVQPAAPGIDVAATSAAQKPALLAHQTRPDAPAYGLRGPYAVGVRDLTIDAPGRQIAVTIWYPALNPTGAEQTTTYAMNFLADPSAGFPTAGNALRDAAPDPTNGPYPLVVYSHGAWCFPAIGSYLAEHLASHGFIVMAPVHEDNWGNLFEPAYNSEISRPRDIVQVLDFAEELTAPGGEWSGLIDMENVAVAGHSFGGQMALEMGGARLNLAEWQTDYCVRFPDDGDCKAYSDQIENLAARAGLDAVPQGLWPDWSDPRIDVVVASAPDVSKLGGGGLEGMQKPILLLMGTNDNFVGPGHAHRHAFETLPGPAKTRVLFENADHMIFNNACPASPGMVEAGYYFVCSDAVWDMDRAHDLTNHFVTAFLLAKLKGDGEAAASLAPESVNFRGIQYETTGYAAAAPAPSLDDATTAKIESVLTTTMQSAGVPGYAMCAVKDGSVVYSKGFGTAELGKDLPVTPQSVFSLRSTTKSFTATALMQLVEQGKIDLDAPVTTYLPYFTMADPRYQDITVRMLASHTSGLVDDTTFASMPPKSEEPPETGAAIEWFVRSLTDDTLTAAPPTDWQYAGTNFILLGDIIGKVSGDPYDVYVTKHLLEPLGMVHSTFDKSALPPGALVGEHVTDATGVAQSAPPSDYSGFESPEAGIYSTCEDMARWMQVNINRGELDGVRILQPDSYGVLWHPAAPTGLDAVFGQWIANIGVGWAVGEEQGHLLAGHPGGGAGQNIGFQLAPDDHLGVTVLANWGTEPDAYPAWTAAADALYAILGIGPR